MFKLFTTKIPKEDAQSVEVAESFTLSWTSFIYDFGSYANQQFNAKVFIDKKDADEYVKQLKTAALLTNSSLRDLKVQKN